MYVYYVPTRCDRIIHNSRMQIIHHRWVRPSGRHWESKFRGRLQPYAKARSARPPTTRTVGESTENAMLGNSAKAWHAINRCRFIGGSDVRIIMGGDEAALLRLWREKRGEAEPEDLSGNLIVQLGFATEHLNRQWYERTTGHVVKDVQRWVRHPVIRWMAATLDGIVEGTGAVFEAKFMLPWSFS